jgi:DNA-binding NarL/FixJ family response regulator
MKEVRILIADDHPIFRSGLRSVIEKERGFVVVAEADDGARALELIEKHQPDVAVIDLNMPEKDGFMVARELQNSRLAVNLIILTMHKDEMRFNQAIDLGVRAYIIKDSAAAEVVNCIKAVISGKEYFSPSLSSYLFTRVRRISSPAPQAGIGDLTLIERRVLYLLAQLKTNKEISDQLGVSPRTVENHRARICTKLELQGAHALTKFALQHKEELA